jgi:hypothetical protein
MSSLDKVLRRSVDDNAWDEESDEVWRGMDRSSRYGRALSPRETEERKVRPLDYALDYVKIEEIEKRFWHPSVAAYPELTRYSRCAFCDQLLPIPATSGYSAPFRLFSH